MPILKVLEDTRVPVKIWSKEVEPQALAQLARTAELPFVFKQVAVMPDVHLGIGATVGSVVATQSAIIPAAVGVDIGCGMCAVRLPFSIDRLGGDAQFRKLRQSIERSVPVGREANRQVTQRAGDSFRGLGAPSPLIERKAIEIAASQLGTLGGGNHFIEICSDQENNAWVLLHSGSRNIGKRLAEIHISQAKWLLKESGEHLPDPDLAYFLEESKEFQNYLRDVHWAQNYAKANRNEMMLKVLKDVSFHVYGEDIGPGRLTTLRVDCHHNYVEKEKHFGQSVWVTRKGAVRAGAGELGIIPGSMGSRSYIVRGKGNAESFCSCSHGAGRRMSRGEAKRTYSLQDLSRQTAGVECRKDAGILDEIPGAYKNIDEVMANQEDLVEILYTLKQLICVKG